MSKIIKIYAVIALTTALAGAAYAGPGKGGGGGGWHGGGGAPHAAGGGGHFGGGGAPRAFGGGGAPHVSFGGGHFGGARIGGAHFGGGHIGGRHFGGAYVGRPAISRFAARPSFRSHRSFAVHGASSRAASRAAARASRAGALNANRGTTLSRDRNATLSQNRSANLKTAAVQKALNSRAMAGALGNKTALHNPNTRAQIAATAATAGWLGGRSGRHAWWRHAHGGFGWVGPLFWPFAFYDIYDYALWGYGYDPFFWDYGYYDIYAGLFYPYGYDDLVAYFPPGSSGSRVSVAQASGGRTAVPNQLAQLCGDDSRDIAGLPIDQIQQSLQVNDAQRAALDNLANANVKAAQDIKAACPTKIPLTAPERLASMQERIEAMIAAVQTVHPALQKFYDLLNDEQRAQLTALVQDQRRREAVRNTNRSLAQSCGAAQPGVTDWPTAEIEARIRSTEAQRASLAALQQASAKAADLLKSSCPTAEPITPPARLEAVANRLDTMLQAVKMVRAPLDDLYAQLTDEQRAQFEAIGPARAGVSNRPADAQARIRRHHRASLGGLFRHFLSMARW
jgi:hypothetical protein